MKFEYLILILFIISIFFDWKKFRKSILKANGEEEIRQIFVPFMLSVILFILFVIILIF